MVSVFLDTLYNVYTEKMFADSSFYEDPEQKYPTIEQQVKMARKVAQLLTSPTGPSGRGQQMFLKRQQMSTHWKPESGTNLQCDFSSSIERNSSILLVISSDLLLIYS